MSGPQAEPVAIIGAACRFPRASSLTDYWQMLLAGVSAIGAPPAARLHALKLRQHADAGYLDGDPYSFDFRSFHMTAEEARRTDPQHRLLLEVTWEALEDAGIAVDATRGANVGVFVGVTWSDHLVRELRSGAGSSGYTAAGNLRTFAANRLSFFFDWHGPSFALDAACASSLVALHQACAALRAGDCQLAIVGAVELILDPSSTEIMAATGVLSAGSCRPLDERADGFVRGEGAAAIVLRLCKQLAPHERSHADILGSAVNHNGRDALLMRSAPLSVQHAVDEAWSRAGVCAHDVDYIELHGTGTRQGDDAEVEALSRALAPRLSSASSASSASSTCAVGSLKPNLGNLGAASGLASVLKVVGCMQLGALAPTLGLESECAALRAQNALSAQRVLGEWPSIGRPRIAGINASSFGGCNAHVVLREALRDSTLPAALQRSAEPEFLALSAPTRPALRELVQAYATLLNSEPLACAPDLAAVCETALFARTHFKERCAIVAGSLAQLREGVADWLASEAHVVIPGNMDAGNRVAERARAFVTAGAAGAQPAAISCKPPEARQRIVTLPPRRWKRSALTPNVEAAAPSADTSELERQLLAAPRHRLRVLADWLALEVTRMSGDQPSDRSRGLFEFGLDSVAWTGTLAKLAQCLGIQIPRTLLFEASTIDGLADAVLRHWLSQTSRSDVREGAAISRNLAPTSAESDAAEAQLIALLDELDSRADARP